MTYFKEAFLEKYAHCADSLALEQIWKAKITRALILKLSEQEISDLSPLIELNHLSSLKELNIFNTKVRDLSLVKILTNLEQLNISLTPVSDLSSLKDLIHLEELNISSTQVSDLSPLKGLTNLY